MLKLILKSGLTTALFLTACSGADSDTVKAADKAEKPSVVTQASGDVTTQQGEGAVKPLEAGVQSEVSNVPASTQTPAISGASNTSNAAGDSLAPVTGDIAIGLKALETNDFALAAREFATAFDNGEADGAFYLGRMYETGMGAPANVVRAVQIYRVGIEKGSTAALNRLGVMHLEGTGVLQDFAEGAKLICEAADKGELNAQFNCGSLYLDGRGVDADASKAVNYFQKAAAKDHIAARNFLGLSYLSGRGTNVDETKALEQFKKTAAQGNLLGMMHLGKYYADEEEQGHRDLVLSHMYFNLAASNGHPTAAANRDQIQTLMNNDQIKAAQKRARNWKPTAP